MPRFGLLAPSTRFSLAVVAALAFGGLAPGGPARSQDGAITVDALLSTLTPEERIGQLVMVNFVGADASPDSAVASLIREYHVGAVLISASNGNVVNTGDTAAQVAELTNALQQRAYEATARTVAGRDVFIPLFVATDNEGDFYPYTNISHNLTPIPSAMTIGATWSTAHAQDVGRILGEELALLGVNMLLGPVVDVLDNPRSGGNGDIGTRSFGGNASWVGALGRAYVRGLHEGGKGRVLAVAKHFPGHGGSDRSTDNEVATVNKDLDQLRRSELVPFAMLAADLENDPLGRTDALMTSHIRYRGFQTVGPFTRPISLDAQGLLAAMTLPEFAGWRREGLVVSDSLGVLAVKKWYDPTLRSFPHRQVARDALLAGNDLLPLVEFSLERGWADHQVPAIIDTIAFMVEQYEADPLFRARADDALRRVLLLKLKLYPDLALRTVLVDPVAASSGVGHGRNAMDSLARDALTLISPSRDELRLRMPRGPQRGERILIAECWADCYPFRVLPQSEIADAILRLYGPEGTAAVTPEDVTTITFGELLGWLDRRLESEDDKRVTDAVFQADWIVFALADYNPNAYPPSGAAKRFLDSAPLDFRNKRLVAIAYNAPYHLDSTQVGKLTAYFAVYSKTPEAVEASVRGLFREIEPLGASPVSIAGVGYDLATVVQPGPGQTVTLSVHEERSSGQTVAVTTSRIADRNGHPVPDGTDVTFTAQPENGAPVTVHAPTEDGVATATLELPPGSSQIRARAGGVVSEALTVNVAPLASGPAAPARGADGPAGTSGPPIALILFAAIPGGTAVAGLALAGVVLMRRRRNAAAPAPLAAPPALRVEERTHRVWIEGREVTPPLSAEQYRLLSYLYANEGRVCSREELVAHVWPDARAEGISEEALDALVRRLRDRLAQAGATRQHIVTLRGHGFRLDR
jgi:beta-N-acetylhexosaminidase